MYKRQNLASIYTFNASLKRRLADFSRKYPLLCRLERRTPEGSVTYVPVSYTHLEPEARACHNCGNCGGYGQCQHEDKQA